MKLLSITSPESLDAAVADIVRARIKLTQATAAKDAELAAVEKRHQLTLVTLTEEIADAEALVQDYCVACRSVLFPEKKSRETNLAVIGFEFTPWRVETASKKVTWKEVVKRLSRAAWSKVYVRRAEPKPDKEALLADREKLTDTQCTAAGIRFAQDEQFFIRPKPETAADTAAPA